MMTNRAGNKGRGRRPGPLLRRVTITDNSVSIGDVQLSAETTEIQGTSCVLSLMHDVTEHKQTETDLLAAVESVMQDTTWLSQRIVKRLATVKRGDKKGADAPEVSSLPERLRAVLALVAQRLSDDEIAAKLTITRNTVPNHVSAIYKRLGIRKRSAVVVWARERGLGASPKPRTMPSKVRTPKRT